MEQKDINISAIIHGLPEKTRLYSPMCGLCFLGDAEINDDPRQATVAVFDTNNGRFFFDSFGKYTDEGEVMLFPSKDMRDWSKFFKKGDVVECAGENGNTYTCVFEGWVDGKGYSEFNARYYNTGNSIWLDKVENLRTMDWHKDNRPESYVTVLESHYRGKMNRDTLEIEERRPIFEVGKLYFFTEEDEDGVLNIVGELTGKNEEEDTLTFGNQLEIDVENFVTNQPFDLRISAHKELRHASEEEYERFKKAHHDWQCEREKERREKTESKTYAFKPFEKVLVRDKETAEWIPAFFVKMNEGYNKENYPFLALTLDDGEVDNYIYCIPYEKHEHLAFTTNPEYTLPF